MPRKRNIDLIRLSIIAVLISMSGWMVFAGFEKLLRLDELNSLTLIVVGLILGIVLYRLGITG